MMWIYQRRTQIMTTNRPHQAEDNVALIDLLKNGDSTAEAEIIQRLEKYKSIKYFDELTQSCKFQLMLNLKLFPNAKEISESMAMYSAIKNKLKLPLDGGFNCVVVGDGHTPRTASLIAMHSNYKCYSIDPNLKMKFTWKRIERLSMYDMKVESVSMKFDEHTIIILPHSHVNLKTCLEQISAPSYTLITMDCCFDNSLKQNPDIEYCDDAIWSIKNKIKIWENFKS